MNKEFGRITGLWPFDVGVEADADADAAHAADSCPAPLGTRSRKGQAPRQAVRLAGNP